MQPWWRRSGWLWGTGWLTMRIPSDPLVVGLGGSPERQRRPGGEGEGGGSGRPRRGCKAAPRHESGGGGPERCGTGFEEGETGR